MDNDKLKFIPENEKNFEVKKKGEKINDLKVLIIEDQSACQAAVVGSVLKYLGKFITGPVDGQGIKLVRSYNDLVKGLNSGEFDNFDIALLDNKLILNTSHVPEKGTMSGFMCKEGEDEMDLIEGFDFYRDDGYEESNYSPQTADGYKLIKQLQDKGIIVLGTSSDNDSHVLSRFDKLDFAATKKEMFPEDSEEDKGPISDAQNPLKLQREFIIEAVLKKREDKKILSK